jgi:hypothetical protein
MLGTLVVLETRRALPQQLQASQIDDDAWHALAGSAYLSSLFNAFVLVDAAKVLCLTFTAKPVIGGSRWDHANGERQKASAPMRCARRLMRRAHKVLDILL